MSWKKGIKESSSPFISGSTGKLVLKLQSEDPQRAIRGAIIMGQAGAQTPEIREIKKAEEKDRISNGLLSMKNIPESVRNALGEALKGPFKEHWVVMTFAEGQTLKELTGADYIMDFLAALKDKDFARQLGAIVAADTFAGNGDRAMANRQGKTRAKAFYNPGNTFIAKGANSKLTVTGIDNDFQPALPESAYSEARTNLEVSKLGMKNNYFQFASLASTDFATASYEAGAIFDRFFEEIEKGVGQITDPKTKAAVDEQVKKARTPELRAEFSDTFANAAHEKLKQLLTKDGGWKAKLSLEKDSLEYKSLKDRKRVLRLMITGKTYDEAKVIAANTEEYHKYIQPFKHDIVLDDTSSDTSTRGLNMLEAASGMLKGMKTKLRWNLGNRAETVDLPFDPENGKEEKP